MRGIEDQANRAKRHLEINKKLKKSVITCYRVVDFWLEIRGQA